MKATPAVLKRRVFLVSVWLLTTLLLVAIGGCGGGGDGGSHPVKWQPMDGVFVWNTEPLLSPATREEELERLQERNVTRLLVSFSAAQIRELRKASDDLRALAHAVRDRGMKFELLLGDSAWILPQHKGELLSLLGFFEGYPFEKIHLDLEPDKLTSQGYTRDQLLGYLLETLGEIKKTTDLPLSLISHWRYVEDGALDRSAEYAALVDEIVIMIYSTKTNETALRFQEICDAGKALDVTFSLAQSVENIPAMINRGESYFDYGFEDFRRAMQKLTEQVVDAPNAGDLIIQAWADYGKMK